MVALDDMLAELLNILKAFIDDVAEQETEELPEKVAFALADKLALATIFALKPIVKLTDTDIVALLVTLEDTKDILFAVAEDAAVALTEEDPLNTAFADNKTAAVADALPDI